MRPPNPRYRPPKQRDCRDHFTLALERAVRPTPATWNLGTTEGSLARKHTAGNASELLRLMQPKRRAVTLRTVSRILLSNLPEWFSSKEKYFTVLFLRWPSRTWQSGSPRRKSTLQYFFGIFQEFGSGRVVFRCRSRGYVGVAQCVRMVGESGGMSAWEGSWILNCQDQWTSHNGAFLIRMLDSIKEVKDVSLDIGGDGCHGRFLV